MVNCYMPVRELCSTSFPVIPVTSPSFPSCLRHSRHFSVTAVSLYVSAVLPVPLSIKPVPAMAGFDYKSCIGDSDVPAPA